MLHSSRKRPTAIIILLAVIGIFAIHSSDTNVRRILKANPDPNHNKRGAMRYEMPGDIIDQAQNFQAKGTTYESTIVTAFFEFPNSKSDIESYLSWSKSSLCINDAMVIFTNVPDKLAKLRSHATDRTIIIPMKTEDIQVGNNIRLSDEQWENQMKMISGGKGYDMRLYKVWAGKSWIVNQALQLNPFSSSVYHWMDIGHLRESGDLFCGETLVRHPEIVPDDRIMLFMRSGLTARNHVPENVVVPAGFPSIFIPGGWIAGRRDVWPKFLERFEETIAMYMISGVPITEDQALLQTTCTHNEGLCAIVRRDNYFGYADKSEQYDRCYGVKECKEKEGYKEPGVNNFFRMKFYFWHGGNFKFWDPATGFPSEDEDYLLWHPL